MPSDPTTRQQEFLVFINAYTELLGIPPAEADMQNYFHITAPSVHQMVLTLEKRGFITRVPGQARSIRLRLPSEALRGSVGTAVPPRKRIKASDRLPLTLTKRERELLLNEVNLLSTYLESRIRLASVKGKTMVVRFTLDDFDELAGYVAASANHAESKKLLKELDRLFARLQEVLDTHTDQDEKE